MATAPSAHHIGRYRLIDRLTHLHPPVGFAVRASPDDCLRTLALAAKPSLDRLHLRDLYGGGRRYYIEPTSEGFQLRSNTRLFWSGSRARTPFAASLYGAFAPLSDGVTLVRLRARTNWFHTLRGFVLPLWMSGIALAMPWPIVVRVAAPGLLFVLAWLANRLNAALEAGEMVFFVQKALQDLPIVEVPELTGSAPDVVDHVGDADFREAWRKFYEEHE